MDFFLEMHEDKIVVRGTLITENYIGDFRRELFPGDTFGPYSYEELRKHGNGRIQVETPPYQ